MTSDCCVLKFFMSIAWRKTFDVFSLSENIVFNFRRSSSVRGLEVSLMFRRCSYSISRKNILFLFPVKKVQYEFTTCATYLAFSFLFINKAHQREIILLRNR